MVPSQTSIEQVMHTAPAIFGAALVALANANYPEALCRLRRLCQLNTYLAKKGLDEIEIPEETELVVDVAMPLAALVQRWQIESRPHEPLAGGGEQE